MKPSVITVAPETIAPETVAVITASLYDRENKG